MHIWIDIDNSKHILFAKAIITELRSRGHNVTVTAEDNDKIKKELEKNNTSASFIGAIVWFFGLFKEEIIMIRALNLKTYLKPRDIDVAFSFGSISAPYTCIDMNLPIILFLEDLEQKPNIIHFALERSFFIITENIPEQIILEKGYDLSKVGRYKGNTKKDDEKPDPKSIKEIVNKIEYLGNHIAGNLKV